MKYIIKSKKYINLPFNIDEFHKEFNDLPSKESILEIVYAAISYAEKILGYCICEQEILLQVSSTKSALKLDISGYKSVMVLKPTNKKSYKMSSKTLYIFQASNDVLLKIHIEGSYLDSFILYAIKLHVKILYNPHLYKDLSVRHIESMYKFYKVI
ncbi:MAG: hypothetical protein AAFO15_02200 [Pseudomonadota bacterium]